ncbi:hypothetical protein FCL47_12740 [Desulfopila sp. IMCC35006]|nr:hypothetical protein FCL47_12740 [Desulfopila sp. IMCC35006]
MYDSIQPEPEGSPAHCSTPLYQVIIESSTIIQYKKLINFNENLTGDHSPRIVTYSAGHATIQAKTAGYPEDMNKAFYLIVFLFVFPGYTSGEQKSIVLKKCIDCHAVQADANHQQSCLSCHKGNDQAADKKSAHQGYIPFPAHPEHLARACGDCHAETVNRIVGTVHFTLNNSTNMFRKAFGAENTLTSFRQTPKKSDPETVLDLADDLLRRRCFRCHLYSSGDNYPAVTHGTGCAACHMSFTDGKLASHSWQKPGDEQCLSCHYGNYVGFDYYGRFEHDFNVEYRTPFTTKEKHFRPYGVEYHQLQPDIHQSRGMLCIDCHSGRELMDPAGEKPSCKKCHQLEELQRSLPAQVAEQQGIFVLHGRNGKDHAMPVMRHPAHKELKGKINCQVCHAQWTFNDIGKHFLRSDTDDFNMWANLSVQGDFAVETIIDNNNDFDQTELPPEMTDTLTGQTETGLWYKGFTMRRWEIPLLGRDAQGNITTMRPLLDFHLSWIDEEENVRFDSVPSQAPDKGLRSYTPHTTGPAGFFYRERIEQFLATERAAQTSTGKPEKNRPTD